jgi:hypothetical protein
VYRRSWDKSPISNCGETNQEFSLPFNVPNNTLAVHIEDFLSGVLHLVESDSYSSPSYHALVDEIKDSNSITQRYNCSLYHNCPVDASGKIAVCDGEAKESPLDPKILLLSANIFFGSKFSQLPETAYRPFPTIWEEYTAAHRLVPFHLVFVGSPHCGQTEAAKHVSKR